MTAAQSQPSPAEIEKATQVKDRQIERLMRLPAVEGAGIGASQRNPNQAAIHVFVNRKLTAKERRAFPKKLEGVPVDIVVTGSFRKRS